MIKKSLFGIAICVLFLGCKEEIVKEPKKKLEKEVMVNVMYDLSLIEAMKYQNLSAVDSVKINPTNYVLKKYKIDSVQFAQNNEYYASDVAQYQKMIQEIADRLDKNKKAVDKSIKIENKKSLLNKKKKIKERLKKDSLQVN